MRILCTGGAGYTGSILVHELLNKGYNVTVFDNLMYKQQSLLGCCYYNNFRFVRADVRNFSLLKEEVTKHDVIIPLAALVGMPLCKNKPEEAWQINYEQIKEILSVKTKDQLLIYPNTNSGYGQGDGAIFTEESKLNPISVYGKTKVESEKIVIDAENTTVFRLATVFGTSHRQRMDLLVNEFVWKAWWDKYITLFESHFKRNYVHVRDVANLYIWCIENWHKVKGEIFNFGLSSANLSKMELCQKIKEYIPEFNIVEANIAADPDQRNYIVLNDKIESRGFKAIISVDYGIQELIKSFSMLNMNRYSNNII